MKKYMHPKYFIIGVILGFFMCSLAGYILSHKVKLHHFVRFFTAIDPESLYYPTASELLETVRHNVSHDKILVLIGGSSILRGTGQDPYELWTNELQNYLGDQYKVINFATNAASFSSYGGVVFRMLRNEYPKIIFLASVFQFDSEGDIDGLEPYDYLFWDAYYKKLFKPYKEEREIIQQKIKSEIFTAKGAEKHISNYLDSFFYFRELWNWVNYQLMFTVWTNTEFRTPFRPRRTYHEEAMDPDYKKLLLKVDSDEAHFKSYTDLVKFIAHNMIENIDIKPFQVQKSTYINGKKGYDRVFQRRDRAKILCVQSTYNTQVLSSIPKKHQDAYWFITEQSRLMLESLGYHTLVVGKNFLPEDYMDLSHFRATGGRKLAKLVADKVKYIAADNNYL